MKAVEFSFVLSGAILLGYLAAGVFFWRFWKDTKERLFAAFAVAFWLLAFERVLLLLGLSAQPHPSPVVYLTRLVAFLVIIAAIVEKNQKPPSAPPS
jgi:uncharacterized membrane protein YeiB